MSTTPKRITASTLKSRGWTDAAIKRFLGGPDATAPNPHYRCAAPMRLYDLERVEVAEAAEEWQEWATQRQAVGGASANRKEAAAKAVETKRQALLARIARLQITVPRWDYDDLIDAACEHFNARLMDRGRWEAAFAHPGSDEAFLNRIAVNYLRHELTSYEQELARTHGKVGVRDAYHAISRKVYSAVAAQYPFLAYECNRQCSEKELRSSGVIW